MKANLYSVRDIKMQKYGMPFVALNDDIAKRTLASTIKAGGTTISEFPEDFQLYKLGSYDDDTGELETNNEFLANATEFKAMSQLQTNTENDKKGE